ncbi:MAG: M23 family metallopeptidase [Myxococcales bacterium]|nr:M23 family metallopeptidase [Myxococcales bacterium]
MADSICGEVEGDYSVVKVQLAGGGKEDKPARPTKGTQLVWGGTDVSSPWGHLAALIEKAGGSVNYTFVHAADLKEPLVVVTDEGETHEDKPADEPKKADEKPASGGGSTQVKHSTGGAEGHGPLFDFGLDFDFGGNAARVWAHPHAFMAGPRPLVIALHGINGKSRKLHPALDEKGVHVGKLASKLIEDGKVTPVIIAAPTEFSDGPWRTFDVSRFVAAVKAATASQSVEIDLDNVSIVGHSGAGGSPGAGLNKVASEGGVFDGHKLKIFGITDTCITDQNGKAYADGLAKNDVTAVYAMHKGTGGWVAYTGHKTFSAALGAAQESKAVEPAEDSQDVDDKVYDNGGKTPLRVSIKIKSSRLAAHHKEWGAAGGYHVDVGAHNDMVPMWFWWALPRWLPATEEDKNAGLKEHPIEDPKPQEHDKPPPVTGGEWANVPPAADAWADPGIDPKATGAALFAPATGLYWPVRNPKNHYGRAVCFIGSDGKGYGVGKSAGGRNFLAGRPADGNPDRFHAGIDVFGDHHDVIVACEAGTVVNVYPFYPNDKPLVWCLIVQHDSGVVINYGEVDPASLKKYGMKKGVKVQPGQPIAEVGRMVQDSMLHFETYPAGTKQNISYKKSQGEAFLKNYFNPTQYLLALATKGK